MFDSYHECQVYTTHQVAKIFQVTIPTVVNWTKRGLLEFHRTAGGHRRIRHDAILAFSQQQKVPTSDEFTGEVGPTRVLLIDVSKDFLETWKEYFPKDKVALCLVHDAFSAGVAIASFKPSVVVVHIGMAGIVADEFVALVHKVLAHQSTQILALSEYISPAVEEQLSAAGFVANIQKPVRLSDATNTVMRYFS